MLPGAMSWSGEINDTVLWSFVDAASNIPWDSMPRSFRGAKFAMIIIFLPLRSSWL